MKHPEVQDWPKDPLAFDRDVPDENEGHAWIQWKGTDVCMDVRCRCGAHGHVDASFTYFYKCAKCGETFCVGQTVRLYPIAKDKLSEVATNCVCTDPDAVVESD